MKIKEYNRKKAVEYAHKWAYQRNPSYYKFDAIGGDCTNFVSQCIFAGAGVMNEEKEFGWYYYSANQKAPAWTGVEYLYQFITKNKGISIFGKEVEIEEIQLGDILQLSFDGVQFSHSLLVVETSGNGDLNKTLVATHTFDSDNNKVSNYSYQKIRALQIEGVRIRK